MQSKTICTITLSIRSLTVTLPNANPCDPHVFRWSSLKQATFFEHILDLCSIKTTETTEITNAQTRHLQATIYTHKQHTSSQPSSRQHSLRSLSRSCIIAARHHWPGGRKRHWSGQGAGREVVRAPPVVTCLIYHLCGGSNKLQQHGIMPRNNMNTIASLYACQIGTMRPHLQTIVNNQTAETWTFAWRLSLSFSVWIWANQMH